MAILNTSNTKSTSALKIVVILDESGSMDCIKDKMITALNDLITEQKQVEGRLATFTLVKFSETVKQYVHDKPIKEVSLLDHSAYCPNGCTSLYDAIGDTIEQFNNDQDVLMVIVTDGQDNSSRRYNKRQIAQMIENKKTTANWSYVYLSCDLSTFDQGNRIGLKTSDCASNCVVNQVAMASFVSTRLNAAIKNCRTTGASVQQQLNDEDEDEDED